MTLPAAPPLPDLTSDDTVRCNATLPDNRQHDPRRWPAWMLSLVLHISVLVAGGILYQSSPIGAAPEPLRTTGIALVSNVGGKIEYFDGDEGATGEAAANPTIDANTSAGATGASTAFPSELELVLDPTGILAAAGGSPGAEVIPGGGLVDPRGMTQGGGSGGKALRGPGPGQIQTGVFGVQGSGTRFVYVFDRSGSMGGYEGRPLTASKRELLKSLADLKSIHQFQIVFYNEQPHIFNIRGLTPVLAYGDDGSKNQAERFVRGIIAAGGTRHLPALQMGISLRPDVIFFLTDADEPTMTRAELDQIRRANRGTAIHAIEFGFGPDPRVDNFLRRLAGENDGQHVYVDISKLP